MAKKNKVDDQKGTDYFNVSISCSYRAFENSGKPAAFNAFNKPGTRQTHPAHSARDLPGLVACDFTMRAARGDTLKETFAATAAEFETTRHL